MAPLLEKSTKAKSVGSRQEYYVILWTFKLLKIGPLLGVQMSRFQAIKQVFSGPIDHPSFWNFMSMLECAEGPLCLDTVCEELEISDAELSYFLTFLAKLEYHVEIRLSEGEKLLIPPSETARIAFDFSLKEWLAFQAHFPDMSACEDRPFHEIFVEKMAQVEGQNPEYDLFRALEEEGEEVAILKGEIGELGERNPEVLPKLYQATSQKKVVATTLRDGRSFDFYPHKIVYLDGGLSIIGEDTKDRSLLTFYVESVDSLEVDTEAEYRANFTPHEVYDFIAAIRAVSGVEERLVLKIVGESELDFKPPFIYLGNPYITENPEGERIWAANVETSPELYEWLYQMRASIQILDPIHMANEFEDYCHKRACERVDELKKVS